MYKRPSYIKIGDLVRSRQDEMIYGFVTYVDTTATGDYYVEVVYDEDADPLYFYDDELDVLKLIKE